MIPALVLQPLGRNGPLGSPMEFQPGAGSIIKEERKTIVWRQALPDGTPAVLKLYRHRTPSFLERRGLYTPRAQREFLALCHLEDHRIACSAPLFWATGKTSEGDGCELLATREVTGAKDLKDWLDHRTPAEALDLRPLFALAAALHRSGLQHGAFLTRNILIAQHSFFLIDFPRSQQFGRSIEGRGAGLFDLKVLIQSLGNHLDSGQLIAALAGYTHRPVPAETLVRSVQANKLSNKKLNALHAVYVGQSWAMRLFSK